MYGLVEINQVIGETQDQLARGGCFNSDGLTIHMSGINLVGARRF
jgi:hypothetical protein